MNLQYLNIFYFFYYQKMIFLCNDIDSKKPKKLILLTQFPYNKKYNIPIVKNSYTFTLPNHVNHVNHVNTHIKNYNKYNKYNKYNNSNYMQ